MIEHVTGEEVRRLFYYEPSTGWLIRRVSTGGRSQAGNIVGCKNSVGYLVVRIDNRLYLVHRLVWLYHFNVVPAALDHMDGYKSNNKIKNLRPCTRFENLRNRGPNKNNTSGYKGAFFNKLQNKWYAKIQVNGRQKNLGYFNTPEEAHIAYCEAARHHHGKFFNSGAK